MPALLILNYAVAITLCFHAVRSGQNNYWLWILLAVPGVGSLVYLLADQRNRDLRVFCFQALGGFGKLSDAFVLQQSRDHEE